MNLDEGLRISVCTELSAGDQIEAWAGGRLSHRGLVTELAAAAGAFRIMGHIGGGRKILDLEDFHVIRAGSRAGSKASAGPEPTAA